MSKQLFKHTCLICGTEEINRIANHLRHQHNLNLKDYYDVYIKSSTDGICKLCNKDTKFTNRLALGYSIFCSAECSGKYCSIQRIGKPRSVETKNKLSKKRTLYCQTEQGRAHNSKLSSERKGEKNPVHKQNKETRDRVKKSNSEFMKNKIKNGYTPPVTNSWCRSKILVNDKFFRSTWEAVFYILNPHVEYEKMRIQYFNPVTRDVRTYIVDFVDMQSKILYEIKPLATKTHASNIAKEQAARIWCKDMGYTFVCISNEFFKQNANKIDFSLYDSKIKKNMKQFLK